MKPKLKNLNRSTPAKWAKIGSALVAVSSFIAGYGIVIDEKAIAYIGLATGVFGTLFVNLFSDDK